jgi:unsaturated rhamnogalacturonyl hydrolase
VDFPFCVNNHQTGNRKLTAMKKNIRIRIVLILLISTQSLYSQTSWVDSVEKHGREVFMPADKYKWDWGQATFLNSLIHLYNSKSGAEKRQYLDYVKTAMETTYSCHCFCAWHGFSRKGYG